MYKTVKILTLCYVLSGCASVSPDATLSLRQGMTLQQAVEVMGAYPDRLEISHGGIEAYTWKTWKAFEGVRDYTAHFKNGKLFQVVRGREPDYSGWVQAAETFNTQMREFNSTTTAETQHRNHCVIIGDVISCGAPTPTGP